MMARFSITELNAAGLNASGTMWVAHFCYSFLQILWKDDFKQRDNFTMSW